ncbi:MAG: hypothetical protein H9855_16300 [Candidatus Acinetobacter avistercoris]|uniref:hypothetical protein n=1 Tax=Acinetobacter sp. KS-LM10 TaxID=3120518 RepID=UPI001F8A0458|nr:hypothetical protein [Candidatus Acinetobacter avistercoris]
MSNTIDGFSFDTPPVQSQIIALAQHHRQQLDEAIFHQEIHLGDYCLAQRKKIHDFTKNLTPNEKAEFYRYYDGELKRIAVEDREHPDDAESGVSLFTIFIALAFILLILYFGVIRSVTA